MLASSASSFTLTGLASRLAMACLVSVGPVVSGCGMVKINGKDPLGTAQTSSASEAMPSSAASGELAPESKLTARFCSELAKRSEPVAARIEAAAKETDPRKQQAAYGQALRDARAVERDLQVEFDAEYKRASDAASKKNVAGTPGWGYQSTNNSNYLQLTEATVAAIAGGAAAMAKTGMPFATDNERGLMAGDVNPMGNSACKTPRRSQLLLDLQAAKKNLPKTFDLGNHRVEDDLPLKASDLVSIEGGVSAAGETPVIRLVGGHPIYKNCRTTGRFSHFDSNGHARYEETCDYAGGRELVMQVSVKKVASLVPPQGGKIGVGDYLGVVGRVVSFSKKVTKKGDQTTTTHAVEIEPMVVTKVGRKNASTLVYAY